MKAYDALDASRTWSRLWHKCAERYREREQNVRMAFDAAIKRALAAESKAAQYERDWYDAKSEFGDAMAKARESIRAAESRAEAAEHAKETIEKLVKKS